MTKDEMSTLVERELMGLATKFDVDNFSDAADDAARDTGFSFPVTTAFQIKWMKQRMKRAMFFMLLTGAAKKVKYEQISLEQEFGHYREIIKDLDAEFERAKKDDPYEFAGVSSYQMFGTKIDAGFQYEHLTGVDTTYNDGNEVIISPNESDEDA